MICSTILYFILYLDFTVCRFISCLLKCIQCFFFYKSPESRAGILINEKFSWYLSSLFFTWIPLDLFHVSCFITVFSFIIFDTSECQHSLFLVIEKITFSFWKILFAKSLIFFPFEFTLKHLRHQEHWTAKTITKHRLKCFDFFSGKY